MILFHFDIKFCRYVNLCSDQCRSACCVFDHDAARDSTLQTQNTQDGGELHIVIFFTRDAICNACRAQDVCLSVCPF